MKGKYFLDTNILVYCFDAAQPAKRDISLALVTTALDNGKGIISWQVVQEFLNVATRKFAEPLTIPDASIYLEKVLNPLCELYPALELYQASLLIKQQTAYSFCDSLIIAAALAGKCKILYSEDLQHGQVIEGLEIINPYLAKSK